MAEPISIQQLKDASEDAITLADFIYKPANVMIPRRLASDINSLQYYLDYMSSYAQHSYETYDEMVANAVNLPNGVSIFVTNDLDATKNGIYTYNGTSFVKGEYQPENAAKDFVEAKLGGLEVFDGKVRAQDVSTLDGNTQESKNTEFRSELDALPFEDGVLADTFVKTTANEVGAFSRNQRDVNSDITSVKDFIDPQNATGDHSQAFVNAHLKDKKYYVPSGTYNVDSSIVDIDTHSFTAASNVTVIIDGVAKDYSYATAGAFRSYTNSNFNFWENTESGNRVARWSNGASQSDSHQFYLPLEVVRDGHGFLLKQKTAGASVDIMFQDHLSDDLIYLIVSGKTDNCQFTINYDTTPKIDGAGGGAGGFDSAMQVVNKLGNAQVIFPSAPVTINQGLNIRQRGSSATTNYKVAPNSLAGLDIKSQDIATDTDIATLMSFKDKSVSVGAKTTIIGSGYYQNGSQRRAFNVVDGGTLANSVKNTYMITSGPQDRAMGEFSVIFILADNSTFTRTARFKSNGTTVTFEESSLNDTLPATLIGTVKYEGDALVLVLHNNGYTGTLRYTVQCDWIQTYYK